MESDNFMQDCSTFQLLSTTNTFIIKVYRMNRLSVHSENAYVSFQYKLLDNVVCLSARVLLEGISGVIIKMLSIVVIVYIH